MPFDKEALERSKGVNSEIDNWTGESNSSVQDKPQYKNPMGFEDLTKAEIMLIQAQNRTTHAIRAVVRFLFIQLSSITMGVIIFAMASAAESSYTCQMYDECGGSTFLYLISVVVIIGGIIYSSIEGWSELSSSDIPKNQRQ